MLTSRHSLTCATLLIFTGYGNLSPTTSAGKATLVFYAIFGIALFLVLLCDLGTVIGATTEKLLSRFASCRRRMRKGQVVMKVTLLLGSGMIPFIFLPALLFSMMESWDYGTSLYYVVVSLSTVGFGDYVAGKCTSFEFEFYALSASKAIFRARTYNCITYSVR